MDGPEFLRRLSDASDLFQAPVAIVTGFDRYSEESRPIELSTLERGNELPDATQAVRDAVREALSEQPLDGEAPRAARTAGIFAPHDPVTLLGNRGLFDIRCEQSILVAERNGQKLCVAVIDIAGFDSLAASLGRDRVDAALRIVAERLQAETRKADTLVRLGHSSFALLAESGVTQAGVGALAEKLVRATDRSVELSDAHVEIALNVGLAIYPDHGASVDALLRSASAAMFDARCRGTGCSLYSPGVAARQEKLSQVV